VKHNVAGYSLIVDGREIAEAVTPRLISLTLTEKIEGGADELEITLANHDGAMAPVRRGVKIALRLGWAEGAEVTPGLVDKGTFLVDQIEKSGPPDQVRITARSADLTKRMARRRDKGWKGKTLGAIVAEVARANGLTPKVHPDLAPIPVPSAEQAAKSDMAFIRDLGRRHDAVATVKDGKLLFMPIGADATAGGTAIPGLTLRRRDNSRFTFTIADREDNDGAQATWHDRGSARKRTVTEGGGKNPKRIKRGFASEGEAKAAARAEARRAKRGQYTFGYDMALGDADCSPNRKVTLTGFDSEIDGIRWLIKQVSHTLDGSGFRTRLEMEST
jgi:phage protein D